MQHSPMPFLKCQWKIRKPDYRENNNMPESPEAKTPAPPTSNMPPVTPAARSSHSASSTPVLNGAHSPHGGSGSMNGGRTPSPPSGAAVGNSASAQALPPACGARQLSKLKRFLTTLQQFGSDISPEIGERVRSLVLGLVNNHLSIEEFHAKLQEATNFPLRPFVIPFLKANLPLLQRELLHCARLAKQSPAQYLQQNEHVLFDPAHSPLESHDPTGSDALNENGKRRSPESRPKENGVEGAHSGPGSGGSGEPPAKRLHSALASPGSSTSSRISPTGPGGGAGGHYSTAFHAGAPIRLEDISMSREMRERERLERERLDRERLERERERHYSSSSYPGGYHRAEHYEPLDRIEDEWKHIENMLHCIIGMVDKTKRALAVLQERSNRDREELAMWMRRHAEGLDNDMKKRTSEMMASTLRQTEDRVTEVKRRAEEAVNEVKRQAVLELQKAVAAAEAKATELVNSERTKMERQLVEERRRLADEMSTGVNHQEESGETCWNCGRKASETCSGCNVARYCGAFCQHKDWENHHHVCGSTAAVREIQAAREGHATAAATRDAAGHAFTHHSATRDSRSSSTRSESSTREKHGSSAAATAAATATTTASPSSAGGSPSRRSPPVTAAVPVVVAPSPPNPAAAEQHSPRPSPPTPPRTQPSPAPSSRSGGSRASTPASDGSKPAESTR